jgi:hypothetical protein
MAGQSSIAPRIMMGMLGRSNLSMNSSWNSIYEFYVSAQGYMREIAIRYASEEAAIRFIILRRTSETE